MVDHKPPFNTHPLERSERSIDLEESIRANLNEFLDDFKKLFDLNFDDFLVIFGVPLLAGPLGPVISGTYSVLYANYRDDLDKAWEKITKHVDLLLGYLHDFGDPEVLNDVATAWSKNVAGPISGQGAYLTEASMEVIGPWTGDAADAYADLLPAQKAAIDHVSNLANALNPLLTECASAVSGYWADIGRVLLRVLGGIARVGSGVLTPDILGKPGELAEIFVNGITDAWEAYDRAAEEFLRVLAQLETIIYSNHDLPGDHWPRPKAVISDTDGWEIDEDE
jgi:hypothetical protein